MRDETRKSRPDGEYPDGLEEAGRKPYVYKGRCDITLSEFGGPGPGPGEPNLVPLVEFRGVRVDDAMAMLADVLVEMVVAETPAEDLFARYDESARLRPAGGS